MTNWQDILRSIGWPKDAVVLDFETYFDVDYTLSKMSTYEYVTDPRFRFVGLSAFVATQPYLKPAPAFWPERGKVEEYLYWLQHQYGKNLERCTVVIQNAFFDALILKHHFGIVPPYIVDTEDLSRNLYPGARSRLKDLAPRLGLQPKGDTMQFKGYTWGREIVGWVDGGLVRVPRTTKPMSGEMQSAMIEYANNDVAIEFQAFANMLPRLVNPLFELSLARHTLGMFLNSRIRLDFDQAESIATQMQAELDLTLAEAGITATVARSRDNFHALLDAALGDEAVPTKPGKAGPVMALAKTDPEREYLVNHPNPQVHRLVKARLAAKSWPTHIKRVRGMMAQAGANSGLLPIGLRYYGGHTGRWSGTEGINPQNLGARSEQQLINAVRGLLLPPEGHVFAITDASQIEARVTGWVAGETKLTTAFAEGREIYCEFAAGATGKALRKKRPGDPPPVAAYLTFWRQFGKIGTLGCGFGMGSSRLQAYAKNSYKLDLSDELSQRAVDYYRKTYGRVVKFWNSIEYAFKLVTKYPHERMDLGKLQLYSQDGTTVIVLPNGRELYYHGAAVAFDGRREQIGWPELKGRGWVYAWGGFLTENVVQAISRDILAEAILDCEAQDVPIGHHVHDEIIGVVPVADAERALAVQLAALRDRPIWAPDCPLDAEGFVAERYGK